MIYKCKFCNKVFKTESGYNKHTCDSKERYDNLNPVVYHLYKLYISVSKMKLSKDDEQNKLKFVKSKVIYDGFVNFYNLASKVYIPNVSDFFRFVSAFNIPIKQWCSMTCYHNFMSWYVNYCESYQASVLRSAIFLKENNIVLDDIHQNLLFNLLYYGKITKHYLKQNNINVLNKLDSGQIKELGALL